MCEQLPVQLCIDVVGVFWRALGDPRTLISSGGTVIFDKQT